MFAKFHVTNNKNCISIVVIKLRGYLIKKKQAKQSAQKNNTDLMTTRG